MPELAHKRIQRFQSYKNREMQLVGKVIHIAVALAGAGLYKIALLGGGSGAYARIATSAYHTSISLYVAAIFFAFLSYYFWFQTDSAWYSDSEVHVQTHKTEDESRLTFRADIEDAIKKLKEWGVQLQVITIFVISASYILFLLATVNAYLFTFIRAGSLACFRALLALFVAGVISIVWSFRKDMAILKPLQGDWGRPVS